jgi:hypothetical protein
MLFRRNSKAPVSGKRNAALKPSCSAPLRPIGILVFPAIVAAVIGYVAHTSLDDMPISIALGAMAFVTVAAPLASLMERLRRRTVE